MMRRRRELWRLHRGVIVIMFFSYAMLLRIYI